MSPCKILILCRTTKSNAVCISQNETQVFKGKKIKENVQTQSKIKLKLAMAKRLGTSCLLIPANTTSDLAENISQKEKK